MKCIGCGIEFKPTNKNQIFCKYKCGKKFRYEHPNGKPQICMNCGFTYIPKVSNRSQFCSRECAFQYKRGEKHHSWKPRIPKEMPKCRMCGKPVDALRKHYCSDKCRKEKRCIDQYKRSPKGLSNRETVCPECGCAFIPHFRDRRRTFCSDVCSHRYLNRIYGHSNVRRARHYGCLCEPVHPIKVFMRDGWKCQICKTKTPSSLRGKSKDNSPEIDHIIPLSKGGGHTYQNTQCVCRKCNIQKSNQIIGQLRLFG